jgi:subtilisin-like proprotein convertase family protein
MNLRPSLASLALAAVSLAACGPLDEADEAPAPVEGATGELVAGKYLFGSLTPSPAFPVVLSGNSPLDWVHWSNVTGNSNPALEQRKAGVTAQIKLGDSNTVWGGAGGRASFSWTGGTPIASASGVRDAHVRFDVGATFTVTVPATTQGRRLVVYGMAQGGTVRVTSTLDGLTDSRTVSGPNTGTDFAYTVDFDTTTTGKTLTYSETCESATPGMGGCVVWLYAAQLFSLGSNPNISLAASDPTPNRYVPVRYAGDVVTLTAGVEGNDVRGVEFFRNGTKLGEDLTYPYEFNVTLPVGRSSYTAKATSNLGRESTSNAISLNAWFVALNTTRQDIPDNNAAGLQGPLSTTTVGGKSIKQVIARVNVRHTWDADLMFQVRSSTGKTVTISTGVGGDGDNFTDTIFRDDGPMPIAAGTAPFRGEFVPRNPLSALIGEPLAGTWRLDLFDLAAADVGTVDLRMLYLRVDD